AREEGRLRLLGRVAIVLRRLGAVALVAQLALAMAQLADVGEQRHAAARLGARRGEPRPGVRAAREIEGALALAMLLEDQPGKALDLVLGHRQVEQLVLRAH